MIILDLQLHSHVLGHICTPSRELHHNPYLSCELALPFGQVFNTVHVTCIQKKPEVPLPSEKAFQNFSLFIFVKQLQKNKKKSDVILVYSPV